MECKKKLYRDKMEAIHTMRYIQTLDDGRKKPIRAYQCPYCTKWHLTSQPSLHNTMISDKSVKTSFEELLIYYNIVLSTSQMEFYTKEYNLNKSEVQLQTK